LIGFDSDLLISITGNLESQTFIGTGIYDTDEFVYTSSVYNAVYTDYLSKTKNQFGIKR